MAVLTHYLSATDNGQRIRVNTQDIADSAEVVIDAAMIWPDGCYIEILNLTDNALTIRAENGDVTMFGSRGGPTEIPSNCYGRVSQTQPGLWDFHVYGNTNLMVSNTNVDNIDVFAIDTSHINFWNGLKVRESIGSGGLTSVRVVSVMRPVTTIINLA